MDLRRHLRRIGMGAARSSGIRPATGVSWCRPRSGDPHPRLNVRLLGIKDVNRFRHLHRIRMRAG